MARSAGAKLPGRERDAAAGAQWGQQEVSWGAPVDAVGLSWGNTLQTAYPKMPCWRLAILQALLQPRREWERSLSAADTGGRNCCQPSCCTEPLPRFHTPLNTSLLLYQYFQLQPSGHSSGVQCLQCQQGMGGTGRAVGNTCVTVPSVGAACRDQGPTAELTLPIALTGTAGSS